MTRAAREAGSRRTSFVRGDSGRRGTGVTTVKSRSRSGVVSHSSRKDVCSDDPPPRRVAATRRALPTPTRRTKARPVREEGIACRAPSRTRPLGQKYPNLQLCPPPGHNFPHQTTRCCEGDPMKFARTASMMLAALLAAVTVSSCGGGQDGAGSEDRRPVALVDAQSSQTPTPSSTSAASPTPDAAAIAAAAAAKAQAEAKAKAAAAAKAKAAAIAKAKAAATAKAKAAATAKAKAAAAARAAAEAKAAAAAEAAASVYYENCDAARAAGAAPVRAGDPGYSRKLDRDGDGVGCEN